MQVSIDIDGKLNSGVNGVMLRNCHISSGETFTSQNYIQNFKKNVKIREIDNIREAFKSRMDSSIYMILDNGEDFSIKRMTFDGNIFHSPFGEKSFQKQKSKLDFSFDFAKGNEFHDFDCIVVCAYGVLIAFSEYDFKVLEIETYKISDYHKINGICAFGNRIIATFDYKDEYLWSGVARVDFAMANEDGTPTFAGFAASEYANDMTRAVRRTGSRLAVFTTTTIEIKDLSQDPEMPFLGYLYQNNYNVGAIVETIRNIDGVLYFVGQENNSNRHIYSLANGVLKKLTNETQSRLLSDSFNGSGTFQECGNTFYCAYGNRNFGIDIENASLFEIIEDANGQASGFLDYARHNNDMLRVCKNGIYKVEAGSNEYVLGRVRLPRYDFGSAVNINKMSFIGEFLESQPANAELTAERGFYKTAATHKRGFDFFLLGIQKLNDIEFAVNVNFRLTRIVIDYQVLTNGSFYGVG